MCRSFHKMHLSGWRKQHGRHGYSRVVHNQYHNLIQYYFRRSFHKMHSSGWRKQHGRHHVWGSTETSAHNAVETVQNSYLDSGIQVRTYVYIYIYRYSYR